MSIETQVRFCRVMEGDDKCALVLRSKDESGFRAEHTFLVTRPELETLVVQAQAALGVSVEQAKDISNA